MTPTSTPESGPYSTTDVTTPDGAALAVRSGGPAGAPALLLLQGANNGMRWWDRVRPRFEKSYRTVTFDYRGTGETRCDVTDWTSELFARDAALVMEHLGHATYAVFGASMGGMIAQHLVADHRDRVTKLVLAGTAPGGLLSTSRDQGVRRILASTDDPDRTEKVVRLFYTDEWIGTHHDTTLLGDPAVTPAAARQHLRIAGDHDAWNRLPDITAPTLILHGTEDRMVPVGNAELMASSMIDARVVLHHGGRHGFFDEFAEDVIPTVLDFLA